MSIWVFALASWALDVIYERRAKHPSVEQIQLSITLRQWLKTLLAGVAWSVYVMGIVMIGVSFLVPRAVLNDIHPVWLLGASFAVCGVATFMRHMVRDMHITVTDDGLYVGPAFVEWADVTDLRIEVGTLHLSTPRRRAAWNGWSGRTRIPLGLYNASRETQLELMRLYRGANVAT